MTYTIAIAGKGGTGKTTFSGLLIDYLSRGSINPLLAVDADPNANLNEVLGVTYDKTISDIREDSLNSQPEFSSMPKDRLVEYLLHRSLVETEKYDLLVMGRPEGKRCYCYVNNLLRRHLETISNRYRCVIIDNEAGMEHLSRMTTRNIDLLIITSDPTIRGLRTAVRIRKLVQELSIPVKQQILVINRIRSGDEPTAVERASKHGFTSPLTLPEDLLLPSLEEQAKPLSYLSEDSPLRKAVEDFTVQLEKNFLK